MHRYSICTAYRTIVHCDTSMHHGLYCVVCLTNCEIFTIHVECMKTPSLKLLPFYDIHTIA